MKSFIFYVHTVLLRIYFSTKENTPMHFLQISRTSFSGISKQCLAYTLRPYSSIHTRRSSTLASYKIQHGTRSCASSMHDAVLTDATIELFIWKTVSLALSFSLSTMPTSRDFANYMTSLGVSNEQHAVYDDGAFFSPRVWWMLRAYGHNKVSSLWEMAFRRVSHSIGWLY